MPTTPKKASFKRSSTDTGELLNEASESQQANDQPETLEKPDTHPSPNKKQKIYSNDTFFQQHIENRQPLTIDEVMNKLSTAIISQRAGINTKNNCGHITNYVLHALDHLLRGQQVPNIAIPTTSSIHDNTTSALSYVYDVNVMEDPENSPTTKRKKQKRVLYSEAKRTQSGLHANLPSKTYTFIDLTDEENIISEERTQLTPNSLFEARTTLLELPQQLMAKAKNSQSIIIGQIDLYKPVKKNSQAIVRHIIAFCATADKIFFIDGTRYNGRKNEGIFISENLEGLFSFAKRIAGKERGQFSDDIFYLIHKSYPDTNIRPAVSRRLEF